MYKTFKYFKKLTLTLTHQKDVNHLERETKLLIHNKGQDNYLLLKVAPRKRGLKAIFTKNSIDTQHVKNHLQQTNLYFSRKTV